ncbi:MAG: hypothetical protein PHT49_11725 [Desulfovibrionales bacterium]|nr:hypothetical protein [Desulfovibrionales bacterium]
MFGWLKRKSEELSRTHIAQALEELIEIANRADANIRRTGVVNPNDVRAVTKAKDRLMIDMCGPVPLEVVWKEIIQPILARPNVSDGAKMAITHVYEYMQKR